MWVVFPDCISQGRICTMVARSELFHWQCHPFVQLAECTEPEEMSEYSLQVVRRNDLLFSFCHPTGGGWEAGRRAQSFAVSQPRTALCVLWIIFVLPILLDEGIGEGLWMFAKWLQSSGGHAMRYGRPIPVLALHQAECTAGGTELSRARCGCIASLALESALRNFSKTRSLNSSLALRVRCCRAHETRYAGTMRELRSLSVWCIAVYFPYLIYF